MQVKVVERDFTPDGRMRPGTAADRRETKGFLPFYSVDTREEADALIELALERGEFVRNPEDGQLYEVTLMYEQTLDNLRLAGERLAALHHEITSADRGDWECYGCGHRIPALTEGFNTRCPNCRSYELHLTDTAKTRKS